MLILPARVRWRIDHLCKFCLIFSIQTTAGTEFCGSDIFSTISSAYRETFCSTFRLGTANGSMAIAKSSGDKGHPCLVPRSSLK
uniref:Uncharacterized protein n=1 Tax=Erpetoichthys calabaricus TaxID=27687 RepID=A0A8C4XH50_ERPCA